MTHPRSAEPLEGIRPLKLTEVARLTGGRAEGRGEVAIEGVAPLDAAGPEQMGFLARKRYARLLTATEAGSFLVSEELEELLPTEAPRVVVAHPYPALRAVLGHFFPESRPGAEIHRTAVVGPGVQLGARVRLDPYVVVDEGASIGDDTWVGAHSVVGAGSTLGSDCRLHPHVVVYPRSVVGSGVVLHSGVRVGSDGFGYTSMKGRHEKMPQVGRAVIEDGVEIGANAAIDRGSLGDTVVGRGTKIDNLVQVAHNVRIGAASLLAALVGIAGSTRIGSGVWIGGRASAINHLEIGDGAQITFASTVMRDVPAGDTVSGTPARPHREELRRQARLGRLAGIVDRLRRLEAKVEGGD